MRINASIRLEIGQSSAVEFSSCERPKREAELLIVRSSLWLRTLGKAKSVFGGQQIVLAFFAPGLSIALEGDPVDLSQSTTVW
jgi:hypothetical protein